MSTEIDVPYLDISDPSFSMHSQAVSDARKQHWYAKTNYGYAVLRHEYVSKLLKDNRLSQGSGKWPDHNGVHSGLFYDWWTKCLLVLEGDDHRRIRRMLNPAFAFSHIEAYVPQFEKLAEELVDSILDRGEFEFVNDFAEPYATRVLCILTGIPESEWPTIARISGTIGLALGITIKDELPAVEEALHELYGYAEGLIADRQANPRDDLVTQLVEANRDGDSLSDDELRNALCLLIFGGMDTTRNQLGLAMQTMMQNPGQWELLAANPDLANKAVEEVMRTNPTTTWVTREAVVDFDYEDLHAPAGSTVHFFTQVSGNDPEAYPNPHVDITADRVPHYGFGGGMHHCLGHFVARMDMTIALRTLSQRMANLRVNGQDEWLPDSGNTGPVRLPLAFDKR
jgi:cytochrome P450